MIDKRSSLILEPGLEKYFDPAEYGRSWGPSYTPVHSLVFEKLASSVFIPDRIIQIVESLKPREDGRYVHVNAVGATHIWGSNKNGDDFPKWSLLQESPPEDVRALISKHTLPIPPEYGYKTFETYAYPFMFHDNKDPNNSIGERVICAAYNEPMERVELILFINKQKAPAIVARVDAGQDVAWSMGCKVPFDVCSICKNVAKNRDQYCEHLRTLMNVILPDGRKVSALNYFPRFFDISYVESPAWRPAYALRKVAGEGLQKVAQAARVQAFQPYELNFEKIASAQALIRKQADLVKKVPTEKGQDNLGKTPIQPGAWTMLKNLVQRDREASPAIPSSLLERLRDEHGVGEVLNGSTALGIQLKEPEIRVITQGNAESLPDSLDIGNPSSRILSALSGLVSGRSLFDPPFAKRVVRIIRISGSVAPDLDKQGSEAYDKYKGLLKKVDVEKLAETANKLSVLSIRDPDAFEKGLFGIKTASVVDEKLRPVLPWIAGIALK